MIFVLIIQKIIQPFLCLKIACVIRENLQQFTHYTGPKELVSLAK